jgi:peptidoglycan/xylan/chitin deacetylase (PgdA/CDA1 family)
LKRITALLIMIVIIISVLPGPGFAAGEIVFFATNNLMLPLTDAMPLKSGGVWYVDYNSFTSGDLKVSSAYNEQKKTLVLYTWDTTLIFNMENTTAYTTDEMIAHKQWCFAYNGTLYVPAEFTAKMLGFEYSYIDDIPLIRIKSDTNVPDHVYYYIAQSNKKHFLDAYNAAKNNQNGKPQTNGDSKSPESPPDPPASGQQPSGARKIAYLTFTIESGSYNGKILDALSQTNYKATFFIRGSTLMPYDDSIRRMAATGHSIGLAGWNGGADFKSGTDTMASELTRANDLLYKIAKVKTRLVRIPGGSKSLPGKAYTDALIEAGYRYWDFNVNPKGTYKNPSANTVYNNAVSLLKNRAVPAVILLNDDASTVSALPRILKYLKDNDYIVRTISILDTPVNQNNDRR